MAPIKIERIVSVSSEDEVHPASNLLKIDYSNKKWKCKTPGEKQISVVFQLAQFCRIISIDVGNEHSAFIEILVGKSCSSNDDYKVLLVSSSLMTLQEAKYGTNINGVSFFKEESLCRPICEEKWDRIKVVCTQPFNNHSQYGLSFIVFHTKSSQPINLPRVGTLQMKASTTVEPLLKAGGLFANRNKFTKEQALTGAAAIRAASVSADVKVDDVDSSAHKNDSDSTKSPKISKDHEGKKKKQNPSQNGGQAKKKKHSAHAVANPAAIISPRNRGGSSPPKKKVVRATVQAFQKRETRPFGNLMTGIVFAISGYENPLRSELRNKALAMGARYEANWNCNCTHLICAFRNTPKYHQVRGIGKIVKKEWIEESYSRRVRLPWRRYALDPNDASQAESEEEIYEEITTPNSVRRSAERDSSEDGGDTDDEIEKVRQKQKKLSGNCLMDNPSTSGINDSVAGTSHSETLPDNPSTSGTADVTVQRNSIAGTSCSETNSEEGSNSTSLVKNNSTKMTMSEEASNTPAASRNNGVEKKDPVKKEKISVYDMDTESEDEDYWMKCKPEENSLPSLPAFFHDATIALLDDLTVEDRKLLTRYIRAHNGAIADDSTDLNTILYAITEDSTAIERIKEDFPQVIGVTPEWIWRSHDEAKLLPASSFKVL